MSVKERSNFSWKAIMSTSPNDIQFRVNNKTFIDSLLNTQFTSHQIESINPNNITHFIELLQTLTYYYINLYSSIQKDALIQTNMKRDEFLNNYEMEIDKLRSKIAILKKELTHKEKVILNYDSIVGELQKKNYNTKKYYLSKINYYKDQIEEYENNQIGLQLDDMKNYMTGLVNGAYQPSYTENIQFSNRSTTYPSSERIYKSNTARGSTNNIVIKNQDKNIPVVNIKDINKSLNVLCAKLENSTRENNEQFMQLSSRLGSMKNNINFQIDGLKKSTLNKAYSSQGLRFISLNKNMTTSSNEDNINMSTKESDFFNKRLHK